MSNDTLDSVNNCRIGFGMNMGGLHVGQVGVDGFEEFLISIHIIIDVLIVNLVFER